MLNHLRYRERQTHPIRRLFNYYAMHHGNTKKLLDAIAAFDASVKLLDVTKPIEEDLSSGAPVGGFLKGIREITEKKHCRELGSYHCFGFDTFGPFKIVGGIAKGHPTDEEIANAVHFYQTM